MVYVTPSHQYPLGVSMALRRRMALLAWAERNKAAIIEDDYDSEFRFGGRPIEPLQTLDTAGRVIYLGSFSKTMLPTLRLGFMVTPPSLRTAVHKAKFVTDWHTALPLQAALAEFIDEGEFARHVRRVGAVYRTRHTTLTTGLEEELGQHLQIVPSDAGLHVAAVARAASVKEVAEAARRASEMGVEAQQLAAFAVNPPGRAGLVLGYGRIEAGRIEEGLRLIRRCFEQ
jgi:GntR family transcriptional regulator/MocR family aminotransferase